MIGRSHLVLAALCSSVVFATLASAECAWVLWQIRTGEGRTVTRSFHDSRDQCWKEIRRFTGVHLEGSWGDLFSSLRKTGMYDPKSLAGRDPNGAIVSVSNSRGTRDYVEYLCFPDTVDPLGPKGGPR
jgi:hypothetical protein